MSTGAKYELTALIINIFPGYYMVLCLTSKERTISAFVGCPIRVREIETDTIEEYVT
jgi:hypothetical protein